MINTKLLNEIMKMASPLIVTSVLSAVVVLINISILGKTDSYNYYLFALYLPFAYFFAAIFEALRASAINFATNAIDKKSLLLNQITILLMFVVVLFFIINVGFYCIKSFLRWPILFKQFLEIMLLVNIVNCISYIFLGILYGLNKQKSAFTLSVLYMCIQVLGTLIFINVFQNSIFSYSAALIISSSIAIALSAKCMLKESKLTFIASCINLSYTKKIFYKILKISSPIFISYLVIFCSAYLFNKIIVNFGIDALAGFGLGYRIQGIIILPAIGLGLAIGILCNCSRDIIQRYELIKLGTCLAIGVYLIIVLLLWFFKKALVATIVHDQSIAQHTLEYLRYLIPSYLALGPMLVILILLEQIQQGIKSLIINSAYFAICIVVGGGLAITKHTISYFYFTIAVVNYLFFICILLTGLFKQTFIRGLLCVPTHN